MKRSFSSRFAFAPLLLSSAVHLAHADEVTLAPIDVGADESIMQQAREKSASLGPMGQRRLQDTPYSISVVPRDLIDSQQLKSFKDIIRYLPSVQADGARPQTRGLQGSVVQNSRLDGLNVVSTTDYPAEQLGGVEVLSGLSGSLYGPANPAGTFNLLSKRPTDFTRNRVTLGVGTGLSWLKTADLSGPFDPEGKIKYRLNLADEQGHSYASGSTLRRQLVSLATDFQVSEDSVIETHFSHYNYLAKGLPGKSAVASGVTLPHAPDPTRSNLGQNHAGDNNTTDTASAHFKHDFDGNWKLDVGALRQIADRESTGVTNTLINNAGTYRSSVSSATASRFTINSYLADLNGSVYTGPVRHELTFGLTGFNWDNYNPVAGSAQTLGTASLSDPSSFAEPDYPDFTHRYHSANAKQRSFIVGDTLTFTPQWSLMLSGSQSRLTADNYTLAGAHTSSQDSGVSTASSLLYKPVDDLTLYLTYADSLQQGDSATAGSSNAGSILSPYRSRMWELGSKWVVSGVNLSLAAFQIKRPFAYTQADNVYAIAGQQRNRGLEFLADGNVTQNLKMYGGLTWLDPKLLSTGNASTENTRIVGLSRVTASLLTEYRIDQVPGLAVNLNARYVGPRPTDDSNDHWVGSYETFDIGASYSTRLMKRDTVYRLEMTNVGNEHYWTNIVPGGLNGYTGAGQASATPAAPRMLQASIQVDL
ncbi:TonB-dependent siderophore receptor [Pseudomonas sp. LP_7_YM]|uniref:TonB-dependent receptor n=1 Tax=Pseudomonas sp. LP_7_YM TaxID=2485137 RepID=UPI0010ECAA77|nr:TonB-dependent receptor [Pseudomonas sp. LP_7_YM]TDV71884.1 iron complex outermembrane receptor protein [Pseudomonas sp. LP_7_YM]